MHGSNAIADSSPPGDVPPMTDPEKSGRLRRDQVSACSPLEGKTWFIVPFSNIRLLSSRLRWFEVV
jgi:hypothetical protein